MEARRSAVPVDMHWEDVVQPMEAAEARLELTVVPSPIEPNVIPTVAEPSAVIPTTAGLPSSSPAAPSADTTGGPQ